MLKTSMIAGLALLCASVSVLAFAPAAQARNIKVIYSFAGASGDGDEPRSDVTFDAAGNLYGTTSNGGTSDNGTIYKITPDGTETVLHSFDGSSGANPAAGVTIDEATGDLYGVTHDGGSSDFGTLYKLTAGGTFTVLHHFTGPPNDSRYPQWRLIRDKHGNLYGVSQAGGSLDDGTLFRYSASGHFKVLHSFDDAASDPTGRLAIDRTGNLYGVTAVGGTSHACSGFGCGAIYSLAKSGTFTVLYSFTNDVDGRFPVGGLTIDKAGNLFGTAGYGGQGGSGTVYRLAPGGEFTTLYSFNDTNGYGPFSEVLDLNGSLYVVTSGAGANGSGTIVKVSTAGGGTVLHDFKGTDGRLSVGGLVKGPRLLYGTASGGGAHDRGVVFSIKK